MDSRSLCGNLDPLMLRAIHCCRTTERKHKGYVDIQVGARKSELLEFSMNAGRMRCIGLAPATTICIHIICVNSIAFYSGLVSNLLHKFSAASVKYASLSFFLEK